MVAEIFTSIWMVLFIRLILTLEKRKILAKNITDDITGLSDNGMLALNQSKNKIKVVDLATQKTDIISCQE